MEFYKKKFIPKELDYLNTAKHKFSYSKVINAPKETIWNLIVDYPSWVQWFPNVEECYSPFNPKVGLHSKRIVKVQGISLYEDIILWKENEAWGFTPLEGTQVINQSLVEVLLLEPIDANKTKLTYKGGLEYAGIFKVFGGITNKILIRTWKKAFDNLASLAEAKVNN